MALLLLVVLLRRREEVGLRPGLGRRQLRDARVLTPRGGGRGQNHRDPSPHELAHPRLVRTSFFRPEDRAGSRGVWRRRNTGSDTSVEIVHLVISSPEARRAGAIVLGPLLGPLL